MSKNIFEQFADPLSELSADHNLYAAKSDGSEGRIPLGDLFNVSAVPTINPVANKAALDALSTTNIITGAHCWVMSELNYYYWSGSEWEVSPATAPQLNDHDAFVDYVGGKPNVYASLKAAIDAGAEYPAVIASGTESEEITLTKTVVITLMIARVTFSARFNHDGFSYTIKGSSRFLSNITYIPSGPGISSTDDNGLFYSTEPSNALMTFYGCGYFNIGAHAHTPMMSEGCGSVVSFDTTCVPGAAENAGIRYTGINSKSSFLVLSGSPGSIDAVYASQGEHESWTITNGSGTIGQNLITLSGNKVLLNNVVASTPPNYNFKISSSASISNLSVTTGSYVDIEATSTTSSLTNVKLGEGSTINKGEGVVIKSIVGSEASNFTGSGTVLNRAANNAVIGNDYHDSSGFDEFTALLDNESSSDPKYVGVSQAYAAGKFYDLTVANVTETEDTTLSVGAQVYLKIGQNLSWNMADKSIKGTNTEAPGSTPNAAQFTIEMADCSSVLEYNFPASEYPFENFDPSCTLVIKGNGGVINNVSTVDGAAIKATGRIIARDITVNLPNQIDGGIHSSPDSLFDNIKFKGGGNACEKAFSALGGNIRNITFSGSYKSNAILNDIDESVQSNISGVYFDVVEPCTLQINGNLSDVNAVDGSNLMINFLSQSAMCNAFVSSAVFLEDVIDCYLSNADFSDTISMAPDNSNDKISFVNCTFEQEVLVYGTNINFTNCHFNGGVQTMTGSTGSFVGCDSATPIVESGNFRREANDSNVGNDSAGSAQTGNHETTWEGIWDTPPQGDIEYSLLEGRVVLTIPQVLDTKNTTASYITMTSALPANLRPSTTLIKMMQIDDNGTLGLGAAAIDSSGVITISKGADASQFSASGGSNGGFNGFSFTYNAA